MVTQKSKGLVPATVVAEALNVKTSTVLDLAKKKQIPCIRFNERLLRFDLTEVLESVKGQKVRR